MNEYILPRFPGDEAETQFVVEPFDFSTGHNLFLPCLSVVRSEQDMLSLKACLLFECCSNTPDMTRTDVALGYEFPSGSQALVAAKVLGHLPRSNGANH